jgi:hypothetical protein
LSGAAFFLDGVACGVVSGVVIISLKLKLSGNFLAFEDFANGPPLITLTSNRFRSYQKGTPLAQQHTHTFYTTSLLVLCKPCPSTQPIQPPPSVNVSWNIPPTANVHRRQTTIEYYPATAPFINPVARSTSNARTP